VSLPEEPPPAPLDQREIEWPRVASLSFLVQQRFRYVYPRPIRDLRHRLVIVPPDRHGDQRTVLSHVRVSQPDLPDSETLRSTDEYGNVCVGVHAPVVASWIDFEARIVVGRTARPGPSLHASRWLSDPRLLAPTTLTAPTPLLAGVAGDLRARGLGGLALAEAVNDWVHGAMGYQFGLTGVHTAAADALALGRGVCQDYAHIMLTLCRALGLPSRYVSGHLLGEGGTHAWVEVLQPDLSGSGRAAAYGFDPTHGGRTGLTHVTVATGRDYRDVAPTAGTYVGEAGGQLTCGKRVDIVGVEYARRRRRTA
jgi:transglutaminase-like putative cysteine protease